MDQPLFIFSLPRSGSTLLQRLLVTHPKIATTAEPWLLLPLLTLRNQHIQRANYSRRLAGQAIDDFISTLPQADKDFDESVGRFARDLYEKQCRNGEAFFLDKTPRYYLIIPEIAALFPLAKFIFLFRPPHQILASIIETWGKGRLRQLEGNAIDLVQGIPLLSSGAELTRERSLILHYRDLVMRPRACLSQVADFLGVTDDFGDVNMLQVSRIPGRMGDPTGVKKYQAVSDRPLAAWKKTLSSTFRKWFAARLFQQFDADTLSAHGVAKPCLLQELSELPGGASNLTADLHDFFAFRLDLMLRKGPQPGITQCRQNGLLLS